MASERSMSPASGAELVRRALLGVVTALLVARPLVPGEDPGLLYRPWTSTAPLVLTQLWFVTAVGGAAWRLSTRRAVSWDWIDLGLLGFVGLAFASAIGAAGYKHPAWLIASEWLAVLCAFRLVRQLAVTPGDQQRLFAVLAASAVSLAAHGLFQSFAAPPTRAQEKSLPQPGLVEENFEVGSGLPRDLTAEPGSVRGAFARSSTLVAFLALLFPVGLGCAWAGWRDRRAPLQTVLAAVCALLIAAPLAVIGLRKQWSWPAMDTLHSTWQVIESHPWLGVGPGNFSRHYPRFATPDSDWIANPPGFVLDVAASEGVPALVVLLAIFGLLFRRVWCFVRTPAPATNEPAEPRQRLEFYIGGMAGLTVGFVLWVLSQPPEQLHDNIRSWGMVAGARSLIWFAAYGVLENVCMPAKVRTGSAAAGVAACLLTLTVSPGFSLPSLAQPFWVMVALAVNATKQEEEIQVHWLRSFAPLPITATVCLGYLSILFVPVVSCGETMRSVRRDVPEYWARLKRVPEAETPAARKAAVQFADKHLRERILLPLKRDAVSADSSDIYPLIERARWLIEQVKLAPARDEDPRLEDLFHKARELDPDGSEIQALECQLLLLYARRSNKEQNLEAALKVLWEMEKRDPQSPRIRFLLAEVNYLQGNPNDARYQADKALHLDQGARDPGRQLTGPQRRQLRQRLGLR